MTLDEFWKIRFEEDNVLEYYDGVKQLFSKPLEEEIPDNYSIGLPFLDIRSCLKGLKEYARMEELIQILKAHHFEAYKEVFYYYRTSLAEHYLYQNNREGLERCVTDFMEMPIEGYDNMLMVLRKMQAHGHIDLVDKMICGIYETVVASNELSSGTAHDLALIKYYIELEKVYVTYKEKGEFEWDSYKETLPEFGFETEDKFCELCETGFGQSPEDIDERVRADFEENRPHSIEILQKAYMKYMLDNKNISFPLSAVAWDYLYKYWEGGDIDFLPNINIENYFDFEHRVYKRFVGRYSGFMMDYRFMSVTILWGTCYIYDFLKSFNYITSTGYEEIQTKISEYKYDLIYENLNYLRDYGFVNNWQKSDMETDEEKQKYKEIFEEYCEADADKIRKDSTRYFFSNPPAKPIDSTPYQTEPLRAAPKIGRNQKVTVEYKDGTIKKDVKYKKVQGDVEMRKCKIV